MAASMSLTLSARYTRLGISVPSSKSGHSPPPTSTKAQSNGRNIPTRGKMRPSTDGIVSTMRSERSEGPEMSTTATPQLGQLADHWNETLDRLRTYVATRVGDKE